MFLEIDARAVENGSIISDIIGLLQSPLKLPTVSQGDNGGNQPSPTE